jgi:hypothetical protein
MIDDVTAQIGRVKLGIGSQVDLVENALRTLRILGVTLQAEEVRLRSRAGRLIESGRVKMDPSAHRRVRETGQGWTLEEVLDDDILSRPESLRWFPVRTLTDSEISDLQLDSSVSSVRWYGVDFDGTLAEENHGSWPIPGPPIMPMVERVRAWLAEGSEVRIVTARAAPGPHPIETNVAPVRAFCVEHFGQALPITALKDWQMIALYDDRAVTVERNTGNVLNERRLA